MKVACIMMQKDEILLLNHWAQYHGNLFGMENLYILDNGSQTQETLELLNSLQLQNANIIREHRNKSDFENKGLIICKFIQQLQEHKDYDFYMPLDCDEFVGAFTEYGSLSCQREDIYKELANHIETKDALYIKQQAFNSPISGDHYWLRDDRKSFFRAKTIESLDIGFHHGKSRYEGEHRTNILQFHLHNKPFDHLQAHALQKLGGRVNTENPLDLAKYNGSGSHLITYLLNNEMTYLLSLREKPYRRIHSLIDSFKQLDLDWPYKNYCKKAKNILEEEYLKKHKTSILTEFKLDTYHKTSQGNIDHIYQNPLQIAIEGWATDTDWNAITGIVAIDRATQSKSILPTNFQRTLRLDVPKIHTSANPYCGFKATFQTNRKQSELDFYAITEINTISQPINKS